MNSSKSDIMRQLQQEFINRTEERVSQLKVIMDQSTGLPIGLQVPTSNNTNAASTTASNNNNNNNDDAMDVDMEQEESSPKKKTGSKKKSAKVTKKQREKEKNDAAAAAAAAAQDKKDNNDEEIRIPTTEELWDYATGRVDNNNNSTESSSSSDHQQHHQQHQDDYYKILQLHQECLQKADEKVAVARQAYEMVDSVVQRLDRDLASMESLLQV
jgi:Inhibitor of growth proteins N-terminal histone-binding